MIVLLLLLLLLIFVSSSSSFSCIAFPSPIYYQYHCHYHCPYYNYYYYYHCYQSHQHNHHYQYDSYMTRIPYRCVLQIFWNGTGSCVDEQGDMCVRGCRGRGSTGTGGSYGTSKYSLQVKTSPSSIPHSSVRSFKKNDQKMAKSSDFTLGVVLPSPNVSIRDMTTSLGL